MSESPAPAQTRTDVASLALGLLRAGAPARTVRALLRDQHGLSAEHARRVVLHAQHEMKTPADAVAAATEWLRQGHTLTTTKAQIAERFALRGQDSKRVMDAAVAELIGDFELGEVDRFLSAAMEQASDRDLDARERRRIEGKLAEVFAAYDSLTDEDGGPLETIVAARKLDRLLDLGWKQRLPKGAFD